MFREHRRRLLELLGERRAAAVIPTATHKIRNHDCEYRFRPDSDFWYLTGFAEPDATLVLLPPLAPSERNAAAAPRAVLFLRDKDREKETWSGRRLGVSAAVAELGVDQARPIERLWDDLPLLLKDYEQIVYRTGVDEGRARRSVWAST